MKRQVEKEQYFTSNELAKKCISLVDSRFGLTHFDLIIEPSAGDGAFLNSLPTDRSIGIDIDPQNPQIIKGDFLEWAPETRMSKQRILTIGNPPFGARAAVAVKFMNHAASFSDVIAFILPMSFNKYTFQDRISPMFHLVESFNCSDSFRTPSGQTKVNTVFQIWELKNEPREKTRRKNEHPHFQMKHAHLSRVSEIEMANLRENHEFAIAQVGSNFEPKDPWQLTQGSYWFISPKVPEVRQRFSRLDFSSLSGMNVAHMSLAKSDIIEAYDKVLRDDGATITEQQTPEESLFPL
ncbi:MAG: hypothetical protein EBS36_03670 [Actinobacteria bacterium]|nr:hypothetical protein [Actinomycetota bacterium]